MCVCAAISAPDRPPGRYTEVERGGREGGRGETMPRLLFPPLVLAHCGEIVNEETVNRIKEVVRSLYAGHYRHIPGWRSMGRIGRYCRMFSGRIKEFFVCVSVYFQVRVSETFMRLVLKCVVIRRLQRCLYGFDSSACVGLFTFCSPPSSPSPSLTVGCEAIRRSL